MHLVVDVGNTETVLGLMEDAEVRFHWRVSTSVPRTPDEYRHLVRSLLLEIDVSPRKIDWAAVASVVPDTTAVLDGALQELIAGRVHLIESDTPLPIRLDVEEPRTVGADRIVNTLAARELYHRDTIAVDLGTATTFDLITADGVFMGGVIAPGVSAGLEWLARRTAKLPRVGFRPPEQTIGRRTETCIQSGIFYTAVDSIDGMVNRIREEWGRPNPLVVATGGWANALAQYCTTVEKVEPFLTLYGLSIAGKYLENAR